MQKEGEDTKFRFKTIPNFQNKTFVQNLPAATDSIDHLCRYGYWWLVDFGVLAGQPGKATLI